MTKFYLHVYGGYEDEHFYLLHANDIEDVKKAIEEKYGKFVVVADCTGVETEDKHFIEVHNRPLKTVYCYESEYYDMKTGEKKKHISEKHKTYQSYEEWSN